MEEFRKDDNAATAANPRSRDERPVGQAGPRPQSDARTSTGSGMVDTALYLLSAGAAQGVVAELQPAFVAASGCHIRASFGAVGTIKAKLLAGEPCDVVILTAALIEELIYSGHVRRETAAPLGCVRTGVAVRAGNALPDVSHAGALRRLLLESTSVFVPDTQQSTAGIHIATVLRTMGIHDELAQRLRVHPNGANAMRALAASNDDRAVGMTQITEIDYTPGVVLAGVLPTEFELATVYSAAISSQARQAVLARDFIALLAGPESSGLRQKAGFVE